MNPEDLTPLQAAALVIDHLRFRVAEQKSTIYFAEHLDGCPDLSLAEAIRIAQPRPRRGELVILD